MSFKDSLIESTKSDASAYMQFISGYKREGFHTYAFVEDDDDMVFYQYTSQHIDRICYLSCGGKENVLKVFRKLASDNLSDGLLFFVDRDTEQLPFEADDDICRTTLYSWENYVCQPRALSTIVSKRFRPSLTPREQEWAKAGWVSTITNFAPEIQLHTSLTHVAKINGCSFGMREVALTKDVIFGDDNISPALGVRDTLEAKERMAISIGVDSDEITRTKEFYCDCDLLTFARGKSLFHILRSYLVFLENKFTKKFYGQYSSPLLLLNCIPAGDEMFNFVREYVAKRLGGEAPKLLSQ